MEPEKLKDLAYRYQDYVIRMRREFHEHPEISGKEVETRKRLLREITAMGLPYEQVPGTGLIVTLKGGKPGRNKLLRADMDGLPLKEEETNLVGRKACVSKNPGACHACGHDAHMAVLLGTMQVLKEIRDQVPGTLYFCFEEGEETNCGIKAMMQVLKKYTIGECFALHVYFGLDAGKVNIAPGPRMAGALGIGVFLHGRSGHASRPDQALNPVIPAAHMSTQWNSAFTNRLNVEETVTLGIGEVIAGTAPNIIPDTAYVGGSARFFNVEEGEKALKLINQIAENTAAAFGCTVTYEDRHGISPYPVVNDEDVATKVEMAVAEICGRKALGDCDKWYASECYSAYLAKYKGALGLLGIRNKKLGSGAPHHNGKFDIDESALVLGVCTELGFVFDN